MEFRLLHVDDVVRLHDAVLNPGELEGEAKDASIAGALSRIEFRLQYGMINDAFELAAMYAVAISQAHAFRDANKRTAYAAMAFILRAHNIEIEFDTVAVGDIIIKTAQGQLDEVELATWLRTQH